MGRAVRCDQSSRLTVDSVTVLGRLVRCVGRCDSNTVGLRTTASFIISWAKAFVAVALQFGLRGKGYVTRL